MNLCEGTGGKLGEGEWEELIAVVDRFTWFILLFETGEKGNIMKYVEGIADEQLEKKADERRKPHIRHQVIKQRNICCSVLIIPSYQGLQNSERNRRTMGNAAFLLAGLVCRINEVDII